MLSDKNKVQSKNTTAMTRYTGDQHPNCKLGKQTINQENKSELMFYSKTIQPFKYIGAMI